MPKLSDSADVANADVSVYKFAYTIEEAASISVRIREFQHFGQYTIVTLLNLFHDDDDIAGTLADEFQ